MDVLLQIKRPEYPKILTKFQLHTHAEVGNLVATFDERRLLFASRKRLSKARKTGNLPRDANGRPAFFAFFPSLTFLISRFSAEDAG
jgi:hypothetical protein